MNNFRFLLPPHFRFTGLVIAVLGTIAGVVRFYFGIKPKLLNVSVFAFYSEYLDDKYFKTVTNNIGEEITILLIVSGLFLIAFSREKTESEQINLLRFKSFVASFFMSFIFMVFATLFTFGLGFVYMLIINICVPLVSYLMVFRFLIFRQNSKQKIE